VGFFSELGDYYTDILPIAGAGAGAAFGGPAGAVIGGGIGSQISGMIKGDKAGDEARRQRAEDIALQREFAQHGLRWKVEDAKAAGLHPLAALGGSGASYTPVGTVGSTSPLPDLSGMGQDISRAVSSTRTQEERSMAGLQLQSAQLDIEGKALDNQLRSLRIREATNPAFPGTQSFVSGQGNSGPNISEKPLERTKSLPGAPHSEPGAIPDVGWVISSDGALVPVPSKDVKERIEDVMPHEWSHYFRNSVMPNFGGGPKPPKSALPKGASEWKWDYGSQGYKPSFPGKKSKYPRVVNPYQ